MSPHDVKKLLAQLPTHKPADDFTAQTLRRLDEEPVRAAGLWRWAAVGALTCLLLVLAGAFIVHRQALSDKQAALQELQDLRAEYVRVQEKLHELKDGQRLVYLGGTDQAEYVVDLGKVDAKPRPGAKTSIPLEY